MTRGYNGRHGRCASWPLLLEHGTASRDCCAAAVALLRTPHPGRPLSRWPAPRPRVRALATGRLPEGHARPPPPARATTPAARRRTGGPTPPPPATTLRPQGRGPRRG